MDLNNDNYLNRHEFQLWFYPSLEQKLNEKIAYLFDTCDDNKDAILEKQELEKHCNYFLKSQLISFDELYPIENSSSNKNQIKKFEL